MSQEFQATESEQKVFLRKVLEKQIKRIPGKSSSPQLQITDIKRPTPITPKSLPPIKLSHHAIKEQPEQVSKIQILKATKIEEGVSQTVEALHIQPIKVKRSRVFIEKVTLKHQVLPELQNVSLPKPKPTTLPTTPVSSKTLPKELPQIDEVKPLIEPSKNAIKKLPDVETKIKEEVKPTPPGTGVSVRVLPDFYELFLECIEGGEVEGAFSSGKPVILVLSDSGDKFGETTRIICQEIYKERPGGEPGFEVASTEEGKRQIEMFKESRLIFIDDSEGGYYARSGNKEAWEKICDRISGFASVQETGFFIFNIREDEATKFYYRLKDKFPSILAVYLLKMRSLSLELKERIASLTWGLVEITSVKDIIKEKGKPRLQTFDDFLCRGKKRFEDSLENMLWKEKDSRYLWVTKENPGRESNLHLQLKAFIVRYYVKEQRLEEKGQEEIQIRDEIKREIPTEHKLNINTNITADVYSRRDSLAIEAETLYEGGLGRLKRTLTKYEGENFSLRIILSNLTFLRHFKELKALKRKHYRNLDLDFWTPNLREGSPISLSEVESKTRELWSEIKTIQKPN